MEVPKIYLNIDQAITCGLIINELMCNSLKHAFKTSKNGEISISFQSIYEKYTLIYSDDGVGIPQELDWQNTDSLGLKLVNALTNQLGGTLELNRNMGTEFKLTFPETILE